MDREEHNDVLVPFARAVGDPLRLLILDYLCERAATVSELQAFTGEGQSKISNHLALLREGGLVEVQRLGRQALYQLASPDVTQLVQTMRRIAGSRPLASCKSPELLFARICHDHLAGRVGVAVLEALIEQGALTEKDGIWQIGPAGRKLFERLGIDIDEVKRERRLFVTACPDCAGHAHLAGALGAALGLYMREHGWFRRQEHTRILHVTEEGRRGLRELFGLDADALMQAQLSRV
jgi:DNA-binding transcriptional ArsR family regulator